ncbi:hypothetical protein [Pseudobacteriovorax antillogorgiicola]|uniref:Uncharacterized protein n=1 Tax=Pseudobacteriovorax antillogorgiicola TaxID=1513793 RepID=A0A1Y6CIP9_9BACT|nr:hypothetical protein [Pseudobacteriovorax antillogorgiicola]TCS48283.1 hypothetical protein EDD56_11863 [Pseudobacteriovorax antillogorgiicola]SMF56970.1 hypothetical protein SAMN06296036_11878 [Pseudobacteriovorax antillogorgiicola]
MKRLVGYLCALALGIPGKSFATQESVVSDVYSVTDRQNRTALVITGEFNYCDQLSDPRVSIDHQGSQVEVDLPASFVDCLSEPYSFPYHYIPLDQILLGEYRIQVKQDQDLLFEKVLDFTRGLDEESIPNPQSRNLAM